jgi:hypothetical protein
MTSTADVCVCSGWGPSQENGTCDTTKQTLGQNLFNYWAVNDCPSAYASVLNDTNGTLAYNSSALPVVQNQVVNLFNTYNLTNVITPNPNSPQYSPFQDTILGLCTDPRLPGACSTALTSYCSQYSRDQIGANNLLTNFCGCFAPPDPVYANLPGGMTSSCDPLCARANTVQTANPATGAFNVCPNNVCAISDINVNLSRSQVGQISFSNICPACPSAENSNSEAPCTCTISGVDINQTLSELGIGTQFNSLCGPQSLCNVNGTWGACNLQPGTSTEPFSWNWVIVIIFVLILILAILVLFAIKYARTTVEVPGIFIDTGPKRADVPNYSYQLSKQDSLNRGY